MEEKQRNQLKRSMKLKAGSLKRYTKLLNLQPDSERKEVIQIQINKIRNEKGEVTTDIT